MFGIFYKELKNRVVLMTSTIRAASLGAILAVAAIGALLVGGIVSAQEMDDDNMMSNGNMTDDSMMMDDSMKGDDAMMDDGMMMDDSMKGDDAMMTISSFSDISKAVVITDSSEFEKVRVYTGYDVPTDGSGGAFGYGVITSAGLSAIIVTTTHAGVMDSVAQADADDPVFHNHYVALENLPDDPTCPEHQVASISFEEPGDVDVSGHGVVMEDTPYYFGGTHSLDRTNHISFNAEAGVDLVVSFVIDPVDADGNTSLTDIAAVCINDVKSATADHVTVISASYWEN